MTPKHLLLALFSIGTLGLATACSDDDDAPVTMPEASFQMPERAYVLAEQARTSILIMDAATQRNVWSWDPVSGGVPAAHQAWFKNPSEVKPVLDCRYILMTASGGAVALIRIADHKLMYYANAGINPHSAELLPDSNLVVACSTGHELNTFVMDTVNVLGSKANTVKFGNAHNAVWDKKRGYLYATATVTKDGRNVTVLHRFRYNGDRTNPKLTNSERIYTFDSDNGGHDLFPVRGADDKLWLTTEQHVWQYNLADNTCTVAYDQTAIKSIDNDGSDVIMLKPTEEWWTEGLIDAQGNEVFHLGGARIYKGRWVLDNEFSY